MHTRAAIAALALGGMLAAAPAAAQERGLYLGGSLGYAQFRDICKRLTIPCDGNDAAWRAFAGYQTNRWLSFELGYGRLGEVTGHVPGTGTYSLEVRTWDLSAVASIPVSDFAALLRFGAYRARTTEDQTGPFGVLHAGGTSSGLTYGAGLGANWGSLGVRAEWQRYVEVGGPEIAARKDDVDVFSVSALFRF